MLMQQVREVMTVNQDDRRIKLDLANVGADGVSVEVRICE